MHKGRIEAFSDGVIAIIITIMVLELKVPHGSYLADLLPLLPVMLCYVLSFVYLGIYWNNHHHLFQSVKHINGATLWANLHLLFWLSLIPFVTAWAGENQFAHTPTALYGVVLFMAGFAYLILAKILIAVHPDNHLLGEAIGKDIKGKISIGLYAAAILVSCWFPYLAFAIYIMVAIMWVVPDRRIERKLQY